MRVGRIILLLVSVCGVAAAAYVSNIRVENLASSITPEKVVSTDNMKPTNFVSEFSTLCYSSEQFGLQVDHSIVVDDVSVNVTNFTFDVSNKEGICHSVKETNNYILEGYFDTESDEGVFLIGVGPLLSMWTRFDDDSYKTQLGFFVKDSMEYGEYLSLCDEVLLAAGDYYSGTVVSAFFGQYYTVESANLEMPSMFGIDAVNSCYQSIQVFIPELGKYDKPYHVRYSEFYEENDFGVSAEYYDFVIDLGSDTTIEFPTDEKLITSNMDAFESIYNYVMR